MNNSSIIIASQVIADIDPALSRLWLAQPFHRHAMVTAFHASLAASKTYCHLADKIAVMLRSAIDATEPAAA